MDLSSRIALQLWSVKENMEKDFAGTLLQLAKAGYNGVEFAGYYGHSAEEVKKFLADAGLSVAGSHISMEAIEKDLDGIIAFEKAIGNKNVVCPFAPMETMDEINHLIDVMTAAGKKLAENGMRLYYHNHAHEFKQFDGAYGLDILFDKVSAALLETEIDVYWVDAAGLNPLDYLQKYNGRTALVHIKDCNAEKSASTIVGSGLLDIASLVKECGKSNTEWLVIEQEEFAKLSPMESVALGVQNLREIAKKN